VSQFSLTKQGSVTRVDLFGSEKRSHDVKIKPLLHNFMWPNEVDDVRPGTIKGAAEDALVVADGFLMPGRADGGLYVVQNPGKSAEKVCVCVLLLLLDMEKVVVVMEGLVTDPFMYG